MQVCWKYSCICNFYWFEGKLQISWHFTPKHFISHLLVSLIALKKMNNSMQSLISVLPCCWVASVVSDPVRPHRRQPTRLPRPWDSPGKSTGVGCHFLLQCRKVKSESEVAQSCPTVSDPMDCIVPQFYPNWYFRKITLLSFINRFDFCLFPCSLYLVECYSS